MKFRNFTIIELLVVAGIIAVLAGLVLAAVNHARTRGTTANCKNNLRQTSLFLESYADSYKETYPYASGVGSWDSGTGWMSMIAETAGQRETCRKVFRCPKEGRRLFSYSLNCRQIYENTGAFGSWKRATLVKGSTPTSKFVLIEETHSDHFEPENPDQDNYTTDVTPIDFDRHQYPTLLFGDLHVEEIKKFEFDKISYYTDKMSAWNETEP